jgi:hypothetical protein
MEKYLHVEWIKWHGLQYVAGTFFSSEFNVYNIRFDGLLCGLAVRVPGYRSRVRFPVLPDFLRSVEWCPLSLARITEELLEFKSSGSASRKSRLTAVRIR